jgi:hypothetical protein
VQALLAIERTFNPYFDMTGHDLLKQFSDFIGMLTTKKPLLEKEVEYGKTRGITAAQFQEFDTMFARYDANKSGSLDRSELKACLFSLGEEATRAVVDQFVVLVYL